VDRDRVVLIAVAEAVATTMEGWGCQPDCTLGTRLVISSLRAFGIPARAVPTSLIVADAVATADLIAGRPPKGKVLEIGQGTGVVYAEGWDGHLLAVAQTESERVLVDTTFKQIAKHPFAAKVAPGVRVLVLTLRDQWPSVERPVEIPLNDGTIIYRYAPQLDWKSAPGWNHPAHNEMVNEVLARTRVSLRSAPVAEARPLGSA
jgi:hypothetical protein